MKVRIIFCLVLFCLTILASSRLMADGYDIPDRVKVIPVAFVPKGERPITNADQKLFLKHLNWARDTYAQLLRGDTFELASSKIVEVQGRENLNFYRNRPQNAAPEIVVELLNHFKVTRFDNPYVFCVLVANAKDDFPIGGGRTINGGLNSGGGVMLIASSQLHRNQHFQTTLQHELGHSFGLPHPDVYGYDLKTNPSIMSYNPANFTDGFKPSRTPGTLIAEDRRALAQNDRVFTNTLFDAKNHVPQGYKLFPKIVPLGAMELPGIPDFYPSVTTDAGEASRSKVINIVTGWIRPSAGPGITYDPKNMWHSEKLAAKPATITIEFPFPVQLSEIAIHSQHSGRDHEATAVRIEILTDSRFEVVTEQPVTEVDARIRFPAKTSKTWKLILEPGKSRILVIRGIRFFNTGREVIPHLVPQLAWQEEDSD